jgi:hypothetical protein
MTDDLAQSRFAEDVVDFIRARRERLSGLDLCGRHELSEWHPPPVRYVLAGAQPPAPRRRNAL